MRLLALFGLAAIGVGKVGGRGCQDMVFTWRDSQGNPCQNYLDLQLCTTDGDYGPAWDLNTFGTFQSFSWGGLSAVDACCVCGGGNKRDGECVDKPVPWFDISNQTCVDYTPAMCDADLGFTQDLVQNIANYSTVNWVSASIACCQCGGGNYTANPGPHDCVMSSWTEWSYECTAACGGGINVRDRTVIIPASNGGSCTQSTVENRSCNEQDCIEPPSSQDYLGCFNNTGNMKMTLFGGYFMDVVRWVQPPSAMTTESCIDFCARKGFARAALQASYMCWCLSEEQVDANMTQVSESDCQARCTGNNSQICGDVSMYSLFSTSTVASTAWSYNLTCQNGGYVTAIQMGSESGDLPFVRITCEYTSAMAQWDTGVLDRNQEEARNITIDEILASAMPSALYRATRRRSSSAFSDYNITYEFPGCDSMARITGFTVTLDQAGNEPLISKLNPICSENFVMRSGFLSTQASIVSYTCADGYFFNKYIIYASMGTNNQASSVTGDLSVQPICSDGTSMPILGDSRDWYRVIDIKNEPKGYDMHSRSIDLIGESVDVDGNWDVITSFNNVSNPRAPPPNATLLKAYSCEGDYMRITSLEASMTYDEEGNEFLHDLQARCMPVVCKAGFTGDGITCTDVDECTVYRPCDVQAVCTNTYGSFYCTCNSGYVGDGIQCFQQSTGLSTGAIVGIVLGLLLFLLIVLAFVWWLWRRQNNEKRALERKLEDIKRRTQWCDSNTTDAEAILDDMQANLGMIDPGKFVKLEEIGSGQFGKVFRGVVFHHNAATICAIKVLHYQSEASIEEFDKECTTMRMSRHPNVVRMLGMCAEDEEGDMCLLMEYCPYGDLRHHLMNKAKHNITNMERLWYAHQTSSGFAYLARLNIVHRDIAARNILLDSPNTASCGFFVPKISDLGMARVLNRDNLEYHSDSTANTTPLPVRWMAPEAIKRSVYTEKSDVWSFGVLIWEIYTNAGIPLPGIKNHQVYMKLLRGEQIEHLKPVLCPDNVWDCIEPCFKEDPAERPTFAELAANLQHVFDEQMSAYGSYMSSMYSTHGNDTSFSKLVKPDDHAESAYTFAHGFGSGRSYPDSSSHHYTTHEEILLRQPSNANSNIPSPSVDNLEAEDGYVKLNVKPLPQNESNFSELQSPPVNRPL